MSHPIETEHKLFAAAAIGLALFCGNGLSQTAASPSGVTVAENPATILVAKFEKTVSTKSLKVGDAVTAKTLRAAKMQDGAELPKGSKLVGKVMVVQSRQAGNGNSMLVFRIDEADEKGGAVVPIKGLVIAIGPSLAPTVGLGGNSVMSRSMSGTSGGLGSNTGLGTGSTPGMDPNVGLGKKGALNEDDIALGSTLEGVALGVHKDADWSTALQGFKRDILLDSDVLIKVELK